MSIPDFSEIVPYSVPVEAVQHHFSCGMPLCAVIPLAAGNSDRLVSLAGMLALLTGILCMLAGLARFGFVTDLLSLPIRLGYLNGIALTVMISQLPKLLGFPSSGDNLLQEAYSIVVGILSGRIHWTTFFIGAVSLGVILILKRRKSKIPGVLVAVIGATVVVGLFNMAVIYGVSVVGPLPQGLPKFQFPAAMPSDLGALAAGAVARDRGKTQ